ncbi:hypothetical protein D5018_08445 [Parashewanella curva]|uniref:Uncharacterized protein n=1 Tax=Parashewanella curva TaxID=2338552 RepID=A0A3L8Q049_9GAMM|nr:hypothetical protein D5018_08445 [Parashewanella curva]
MRKAIWTASFLALILALFTFYLVYTKPIFNTIETHNTSLDKATPISTQTANNKPKTLAKKCRS